MTDNARIERRRRGFERAASLVSSRVRTAGESRGFAVSRLLTHWSEVVGEDIAAVSRPVEISYGRGFGATLTLLTTGAAAPMLDMQKPQIVEKVNACYGYSAIRRVRIVQTSATGFEDGRATFRHAAQAEDALRPPTAEVRQATGGIGDESLRAALERLGTNVLSRKRQ